MKIFDRHAVHVCVCVCVCACVCACVCVHVYYPTTHLQLNSSPDCSQIEEGRTEPKTELST